MFFAPVLPPWLPYACPILRRCEHFRRDAFGHARIVAANGGKVMLLTEFAAPEVRFGDYVTMRIASGLPIIRPATAERMGT
jgi:hypothetical protein